MKSENQLRLIAMDLDGTLTQHKQPLSPENRAALERLAEKYRLLTVGAGQVMRIFRQMEGFPIDIIGNYGMQMGRWRPQTGEIEIVRDIQVPCDRASAEERVTRLREAFGLTEYRGGNVEFHPSGCLTFPCLGTAALPADKLAFDPDRQFRRTMYPEVCRVFDDYNVFVGGSSSFDLAPRPYNKHYALSEYCREAGFTPDEVLYIGDDYGPGGNDESVFLSEFRCLPVDDYRLFPETVKPLLQAAVI